MLVLPFAVKRGGYGGRLCRSPDVNSSPRPKLPQRRGRTRPRAHGDRHGACMAGLTARAGDGVGELAEVRCADRTAFLLFWCHHAADASRAATLGARLR